jgi:hypothetical protein
MPNQEINLERFTIHAADAAPTDRLHIVKRFYCMRRVSMTISKIEKPAWSDYFNRMSKVLVGKDVEIEVDSLATGQQIEANWSPFLGIVYEPKSDMIEIVLEGLDHMIHKPKEVYADNNASSLVSLEVIGEDDVRQIIKLRDPLMLPLH